MMQHFSYISPPPVAMRESSSFSSATKSSSTSSTTTRGNQSTVLDIGLRLAHSLSFYRHRCHGHSSFLACIVPLAANNLQSGWFWAASIASDIVKLQRFRSSRTLFIAHDLVILAVFSSPVVRQGHIYPDTWTFSKFILSWNSVFGQFLDLLFLCKLQSHHLDTILFW